MKYAQILNRKVHWTGEYNVAPDFNSKAGQFIDITDMTPQPEEGWGFEDGIFIEPEIPEPVHQAELKLSTDKAVIQADGIEKATVSIRLEIDGKLDDSADGLKFYIPLMRIDDYQEDLLKGTLSGGLGTIEFSTTTASIYTVRMDLIRPRATAMLTNNIEIIAE